MAARAPRTTASRRGWALAAGSLSLLAFWVLGSRDEGKAGDAGTPGQDEEE